MDHAPKKKCFFFKFETAKNATNRALKRRFWPILSKEFHRFRQFRKKLRNFKKKLGEDRKKRIGQSYENVHSRSKSPKSALSLRVLKKLQSTYFNENIITVILKPK